MYNTWNFLTGANWDLLTRIVGLESNLQCSSSSLDLKIHQSALDMMASYNHPIYSSAKSGVDNAEFIRKSNKYDEEYVRLALDELMSICKKLRNNNQGNGMDCKPEKSEELDNFLGKFQYRGET